MFTIEINAASNTTENNRAGLAEAFTRIKGAEIKECGIAQIRKAAIEARKAENRKAPKYGFKLWSRLGFTR